MTSRLSTVAADLAEQLEPLPATLLRRIAAEAAEFAVARTLLADPRLNGALAALRDGVQPSQGERSAVRQLTEELDEAAWDAQDKADEGTLPQQDYLDAFARARAAASVGFASEPDALRAALESVYEAQAAVADIDAVRTALHATLAGELTPTMLPSAPARPATPRRQPSHTADAGYQARPFRGWGRTVWQTRAEHASLRAAGRGRAMPVVRSTDLACELTGKLPRGTSRQLSHPVLLAWVRRVRRGASLRRG
jgi:hypothetical protein